MYFNIFLNYIFKHQAKEKVVVVFSQSLPLKGPFIVDFVGKKAMQVVAKQLNNCTLQLESPRKYIFVYNSWGCHFLVEGVVMFSIYVAVVCFVVKL